MISLGFSSYTPIILNVMITLNNYITTSSTNKNLCRHTRVKLSNVFLDLISSWPCVEIAALVVSCSRWLCFLWSTATVLRAVSELALRHSTITTAQQSFPLVPERHPISTIFRSTSHPRLGVFIICIIIVFLINCQSTWSCLLVNISSRIWDITTETA